MSRQMRVLIIDDHPLVREGIKSILEQVSRFKVEGEAGSVKDGLEKIQEKKYDIILLDVSLSDGNGLRYIKKFKAFIPDVHVVVVSMHAKVEYVTEAFQSGATGYVIKDSAGEKLLFALETVLAGEFYIDSSVSKEVMQRLSNTTQSAPLDDGGYTSLTEREQQVLRHVATGMSPAEIGELLFISQKTVENYKSRIIKTLGLKNSADIVRYALKVGLVDVMDL